MAHVFPREITGFLPGRSSLDACYAQQRRLERAREHAVPFSGCCLDLIKCFNTIRRQVPLTALAHMGLPADLIDTWSNSMQHLQRTWILGSYASTPVTVNNGLCEGDSFSVVGMLCLGMMWVTSVRHHDPISELSAFADNWSWATIARERHMQLAQTTQAITTLAGMSIDWTKSWIWSTAKPHLSALQQAIAQITDATMVQRLTHEMDLGCVFQFCGSHRLGKFAKRLKEGLRRFQMLQQMPHDMDTKLHLARAGIFPQALYGAELLPLGSQHLTKFRNQLADSVLGKNHSRNSAIAIACIPTIMDPEPYLVFQALRAARRHLLRATDSEVQDFCYTVSRHSGSWNHCHGPAGALAYYLRKVDWQLTDKGEIWATGFVKFSLLKTGIATLKRWLLKAWNDQLLPNLCNRRPLQGLQPIAIPETQQVLAKFEAKPRRALLNEIAGGFQARQQQAGWDADCDGSCQHCGEPDTRFPWVPHHGNSSCQICRHPDLVSWPRHPRPWVASGFSTWRDWLDSYLLWAYASQWGQPPAVLSPPCHGYDRSHTQVLHGWLMPTAPPPREQACWVCGHGGLGHQRQPTARWSHLLSV